MRDLFNARIARPIAALRAQDQGQTLVEYVLITGLVSIALITTLVLLEGGLATVYNAIVSKL